MAWTLLVALVLVQHWDPVSAELRRHPHPTPTPVPVVGVRMGRMNMTGFEVGFKTAGTITTGPDNHTVPTGTVTRDTSIFRSGVAAAKFNSGAGNAAAKVEIDIGSADTSSASCYFRAYLYFADLPSSTVRVVALTTGSTQNISARLTSGGKVQLWNDVAGTQIGSDSAATISTGQWYRFEIGLTFDGSSNVSAAELQLDGTSVASSSTSGAGITNFYVGWWDAPGASKVMYADDLAINDSTGASNNSWPGDGAIVLALPISDSQRGSWTGGAGGTTNLWNAVNNTPPIGTATETDLTQIESVDASGDNATDEYRAALTTYTDMGIGASDTVNALMALICSGEDVNTGTKTGSGGWQANPANTYKTFTFGADLGALGTYNAASDNWGWTFGGTNGYVDAPSVTLGSSPILAVRKTDTGTRVASICFLGAYVDYTPAAAPAVVTPFEHLMHQIYPSILAQ